MANAEVKGFEIDAALAAYEQAMQLNRTPVAKSPEASLANADRVLASSTRMIRTRALSATELLPQEATA
jgi:hypothetical protein